MNLETKITIYKFTPQLFTLTQKQSMPLISGLAHLQFPPHTSCENHRVIPHTIGP